MSFSSQLLYPMGEVVALGSSDDSRQWLLDLIVIDVDFFIIYRGPRGCPFPGKRYACSNLVKSSTWTPGL